MKKAGSESESLWTDFYNISWSPTNQTTDSELGFWEQARDTRTGDVYDDWFNTETTFARDYGKHNAREGWATSWEGYFFNAYYSDLVGKQLANNSCMQSKIDALDAFFNSFSN